MALPRQRASRLLSNLRTSSYICESCKLEGRIQPYTIQNRRFTTGRAVFTSEQFFSPPGSRAVNYRFPNGGRIAESSGKQKHVRRRFHAAPAVAQEKHSRELTKTQPSSNYTPAETWDGLEHVGNRGNWRDIAPEPQDKYQSWLASTSSVASSYEEILSCLHQSIVECLTCAQADIDPSTVLWFNSREIDSEVYASSTIISAEKLSNVEFVSEEEKQQLLGLLQAVAGTANQQGFGNFSDMPKSEVDNLVQEEQQAQMGEITPIEPPVAEAQFHETTFMPIDVVHYQVSNVKFLDSRLNIDDPLTFIILKRFTQLSGLRISDHILNTAASGNRPLSYLVDRLFDTVKPKPRNLADELMQKETLAGQSNVWVLPRRETPIDREKSVGRWKIIEQELQDRGLPVTGKVHM